MNTTAPPASNVVAARRPQPTDFKPIGNLQVGELLEDPRVYKAIAESAPKHLSPQRLLRVMAQCLRKTPKLAQCSPLSLLGSMITCSFLGLEPNTPLGHCYLIPFDKRGKNPATGRWEVVGTEVNLIIGYQGLIDLSRRTGSLVSIHADVVYEGDEFDYEYGSNMFLRHKPVGDTENRKPIYAYAHAKLEDGQAFEVLPYPRVLAVRDQTQAYQAAMDAKSKGHKNWATAPWIAYEHEMAQKTLVRRLSKWLPKSIEFASAVALDSMADREMIDFRAIAQQPSLAQDPEIASLEDEQQEQGNSDKGEPPPPPPKPPAQAKAKTSNETAKPKATPPAPPPPTEADEREADRMQRAAQEGGPPAVPQEEEEPPVEQQADDGWNAYLEKMLTELAAAKSKAVEAAVAGAFKDAVIGAVERNQIAEERGNDLLKQWVQRASKGKG